MDATPDPDPRPRRRPAALVPIVVGLALVAAACAGSGTDDGPVAAGSTPGGTPAPADGTASVPVGTAPAAEGEPPWSSATCAGPSTSAGTHAYRDPVPAGTDPDLVSLDVWVPQPVADGAEGCDAVPVLVWVHGGGWRTGDKTNKLQDKQRYAAERGWILVSTNYRLTPAVRYPTHNEDVAAAVAWVVDGIDGYGGDPGRIALLGHSAGAGIAAAVAVDPRYLGAEGLGPDALSCSVLLDTEAYDVTVPAARSALYRAAFTDDPEVQRDASPIRHIDPDAGTAPVLVVTRGRDARQALSADVVAALRDAGVDATLLDADPLDHGGVNAAVGDPDDEVVMPTLDPFLRACLG